ncbi:MAG: radical SAM protein, partial [Pseudomonadota bacterium]
GGHHATFLAEQLLRQESSFDSVIRGEGELTILDLADRLRLELPLQDTLGLWFKEKGGTVCKNPGRKKIDDLNSIPFPARDTLQAQLRGGGTPTARVISSRGCVADCSFCSIPPFERLQKGQLWRARSAENVLDELTYLRNEFGVKIILFAEDNFIGPGEAGRERVRQIAEGMKARGLGLRFRILCTAESLVECEPLLPLLKEAGLERVIVGIESASPSTLAVFNKKTTVEQHYRIARMLARHDIVLHLGFMMFQPYSTIDDLRANAEFLSKINQACFFQHLSNRMELYPGVAMFDRLEKEEMIVSTKEYKRGFLYRYANPDVEKLARSLSPIRRRMVDLDKLLLDTDIWISHHNGNSSCTHFINKYTTLKKEISSRNLEFFLKSLSLVEPGWNSETFEGLKNGYLHHIEELGEALQSIVGSIDIEDASLRPV